MPGELNATEPYPLPPSHIQVGRDTEVPHRVQPLQQHPRSGKSASRPAFPHPRPGIRGARYGRGRSFPGTFDPERSEASYNGAFRPRSVNMCR